ncbi:hypothetical protein QF002_002042 [Paraburkholderia youngii]
MHFRHVDEAATGLVADERVVFPAIPQRLHHFGEFGGPLVTLGMVRSRVAAEVARRRQIGGGHDVPAGPAVADVIERRTAPGNVVRLVVAGRGGADHADVSRRRGDAGE